MINRKHYLNHDMFRDGKRYLAIVGYLVAIAAACILFSRILPNIQVRWLYSCAIVSFIILAVSKCCADFNYSNGRVSILLLLISAASFYRGTKSQWWYVAGFVVLSSTFFWRKKLIKWFDSFIPVILIAFLAAICIRVHDNLSEPQKIISNIDVIKDTLDASFSIADVHKHNAEVLNAIVQNSGSESNQIAAVSSSEMQTRNFYGVVIALIAPYAFGLIRRSPAPKNQKAKSFLGVAILAIVIFGMYGVDVHYKLTIERMNGWSISRGRAVDTLLSRKPNDLRVYKFNYGNIQKSTEHFYFDQNERLPRELASLFNPDIEQMVFYIFPMMLACGYLLLTSKLGRTLSRQRKIGNDDSHSDS